MGVYLHYQAVPEASRLARRLRTEQRLCAMYAELIHHPAGPYDADRLSPAERDLELAAIALNPIFGSRAVADGVYADLHAELARAADEFPGLPQRSAYLKLHDYFDDALTRALARLGRRDAGALVGMLVMGAEPFVPDEFGIVDTQLQLVPSPLVAEAAALFRVVGPEGFGGWEDTWAAFRAVYAGAAARGEALVVA